MTDMDKPCPHESFDVQAMINRVQGSGEAPEIVAFYAEIAVQCHDCGEPFRWTGVEAGLRPDRPMCSVDERELRAPIRPASADPDFGMGIPGFAVRYHEGQPS